MSGPVVDSAEPVTILGGGNVTAEELQTALLRAPKLVAADGGADFALIQDKMPDAVIGDFDSISPDVRAHIPDDRLFHDPDQHDTDFDKCLRLVRAPLIVGVGFLGARLDHQLAVLSGMVRRPEQRCVLLGGADVAFVAPPDLMLDLPLGSRLSLFPMGAVRGQSRGLEWPIDDIDFAPDGRIGTSNRVSATPVLLRFDAARMVVIAPRTAFEQVCAALLRD